MVKSCEQIEEEIFELKRKLQQSRFINFYNKTIANESVENEISLESTEETRNASRN
jgi:hypothetical protein